MLSKYHQHAILTGCVDSFCLVCESQLRSEEDAATHIQKPVHLKNLRSSPYLEKFNNDHIRKVKKGYFCEFCNLLLPTAAKVGLHTSETNHNNNKVVGLIKRIGNSVVVFGNILITELAWNGLISDTCAVCNVEFTNLKLHVADQKHLLNLIQKNIEFGDGSPTVYRKIDHTSFHCLICNAIFALNTVKSHSNDNNHKTSVDKCHKSYQANFENNKESQMTSDLQNSKDDTKSLVDKNINNASGDEEPRNKKYKQTVDMNDVAGQNSNAVDKTEFFQIGKKPAITRTLADKDLNEAETKYVKDKKQTQRDKLFENLNKFAKNGVNINFETETAFCRKCFESVDLEIEVIKMHISEHKSGPMKEVTANTVHTLNEKCSKTVLNSKELEEQSVKKGVNVKLDHNNVSKDRVQESSEEEIIKIDLRKTVDTSEENKENNALVEYVPGASAAEPPKPKKEVKDMNDPATFAKYNNLTYNKGNGNAYCRTCNKKIPAAIKNMQEHVGGMSHKAKIARIAQEEKAAKAAKANSAIPRKPMEKFVYWKSTVKNITGVDDVILNDKYCLTRMSYYMITVQNRLRCQACEVNLVEEEVLRHVDTARHEQAMEDTPVVTSFDSEFIREVRTGLFHCGYCNLMLGPWEGVSCHLSCSEHERRKRDAAARREEHLHRERRAERELMVWAFLQNYCPGFFF